jgi:hypothetical protein
VIDVRVTSARLYPPAALEAAADAFRGVCEVRVEPIPEGARVTVVVPEGGGREVADEFFNLALAASVEALLDSPA